MIYHMYFTLCAQQLKSHLLLSPYIWPSVSMGFQLFVFLVCSFVVFSFTSHLWVKTWFLRSTGRRQMCNFLRWSQIQVHPHQPPPPCRQNSTPTRSKSFTWGAGTGKSVSCTHWSPRLDSRACLQKRLVMTSPKQPVIGSVRGLQWNWPSEQTGPDWGSAFCLCPDHQSSQRTAKRQKEAKKH